MEQEQHADSAPGLNDGKSKARKPLQPAALETPFRKIALSLSGGGFRAAAYSLGTMSYLYHLPYPDTERPGSTLLDNVAFIASASGGSFTGMLYAMHVSMALPFSVTFDKMLGFLDGQVVLDDVLDRLNDQGPWKPEGSKNLINAFASIYDEKLFDGHTFGVYSTPVNGGRRMEICINATEFYRGISFRFQAGNFLSTAKVGNKYVYFNTGNKTAADTAHAIKLGDIMAASSCFPGGFEPMMFPGDFAYETASTGKKLTAGQLRDALIITDYNNNPRADVTNVGLMDGGIDDNQGLYSTLLADERRRSADPSDGFDLIFISDVASYFMDAYKLPEESGKGDIRKTSPAALLERPLKSFLPHKISRLTNWSWLTLALTLAAVLACFLGGSTTVRYVAIGAGAAAACLTVLLVLIRLFLLNKPVKALLPAIFRADDKGLVSLLKKNIQGLEHFTDEVLGKLVTYVRNAPIGKLEQIAQTRLNSMLSLVMDINLKQTRRLIFDLFYGRFSGPDTWRNRSVFNVIYELSEKNVVNREKVLKDKLEELVLGAGQMEADDEWVRTTINTLTSGCGNLNAIAEKARTMGTTLWTDEQDLRERRIRDVVCTGQFTTCAKLLEYCLVIEQQLHRQATHPDRPGQLAFNEQQLLLFRTLKEKIAADWSHFKKDPYFLFNEQAKSESKEDADHRHNQR